MDKRIKSPKDCNESELAEFKKMVLKGGEVTERGLSDRIADAKKLAFIYSDEGKLVAVGGIKTPNSSYKKGVFNKANVTGQEDYNSELGWIYVSENERNCGYGRSLMELINNELSGKICYATTRKDNKYMLCLLERFDFVKDGHSYRNNDRDYDLVLCVKRS